MANSDDLVLHAPPPWWDVRLLCYRLQQSALSVIVGRIQYYVMASLSRYVYTLICDIIRDARSCTANLCKYARVGLRYISAHCDIERQQELKKFRYRHVDKFADVRRGSTGIWLDADKSGHGGVNFGHTFAGVP